MGRDGGMGGGETENCERVRGTGEGKWLSKGFKEDYETESTIYGGSRRKDDGR